MEDKEKLKFIRALINQLNNSKYDPNYYIFEQALLRLGPLDKESELYKWARDWYKKNARRLMKWAEKNGKSNAAIDIGYESEDEDLEREGYEVAARLDNIEGMHLLASYHYEHENYDLYFKFENQAAKLGDIEGICNTARCYLYGIGVEEDVEKTAKLWLSLVGVKARNTEEIIMREEALYGLAEMYYSGDGIDRSYKKAFYLFKKLAKPDDGYESDICLNAQERLAYMYEKGQGVKRNLDEAEKILELLRKKSNVNN